MMINSLPDKLPALVAPQGVPAFLPDEINAYCVKCKTSHPMVGPQIVTTKSGKPAARGKCPICHTTMMKLLPTRYA